MEEGNENKGKLKRNITWGTIWGTILAIIAIIIGREPEGK